jgi:YVTN family beta-propeller protein
MINLHFDLFFILLSNLIMRIHLLALSIFLSTVAMAQSISSLNVDTIKLHNDSLQMMPYNRIIASAGNVLRFGNPIYENHALDVAAINEHLAAVQDRYGILIIDTKTSTVIQRWLYTDVPAFKKLMSTYSGIKVISIDTQPYIFFTASDNSVKKGAVLMAKFTDTMEKPEEFVSVSAVKGISPLPNDINVQQEQDKQYLYLVLNGTNELHKYNLKDHSLVWKAATGVAPYGVAAANGKLYVTNWAGPTATDSVRERAGVPWGLAYTNPQTGATAEGSVSVFQASDGKYLQDIATGLHPNSIKASENQHFIYVCNSSSDNITVIATNKDEVVETIPVGLLGDAQKFQGSTPNALVLSADNTTLYVANGLDNAIAVIHLGKKAASKGSGKTTISGFIPTEAYPGGIAIVDHQLVVTNIESAGANVIAAIKNARSIHNQLGSISIIPIPDKTVLMDYTQKVLEMNFISRYNQSLLTPREGVKAVPVPERIGEPSVFKHVVYIIKENKTYDQVLGDVHIGNGDSSLCVFGEKITPNMHALTSQFGLLDNYYASGKSSAEGHQWTDAAMVSDYVEKSVRAWFRSYPHRQEDALVYNTSGFIWNNALDHGKKVRIYGEACETIYDKKLKWADLYNRYTLGQPAEWHNTSTIARILPIISPDYPDCDNIVFNDQQRADVFIREFNNYALGDSLPDLMILSLPNDHSAGTSPGFPTPNAMVADNDLALGRIIDVLSKSKYWDSTVVFVTQDDSQGGWDHISAYRTVGAVISPYSTGKLVSTNYNQTSMVRTIEQILGLPPMNVIDATAKPMVDCFQAEKNAYVYHVKPNTIPLDEMNKDLKKLSGISKKFARQSLNEVFNEVDGGEDDKMNRIIWFYSKGNLRYPDVLK